MRIPTGGLRGKIDRNHIAIVRVAGTKSTVGVFQAIEEVVHWDVNKSK